MKRTNEEDDNEESSEKDEEGRGHGDGTPKVRGTEHGGETPRGERR